MPDNRFPAPGTDTRFETPGVDARFPSPGTDTRFTGGADTRFEDVGPVAPTVVSLSVTSVLETALVGSVVATISANGNPAPTFSEIADPDAKFTVSGNQLLLGAAVDYETKTSHAVTIRATNASGTKDQAFTITVLNVSAPTDIQLSGTTVAEDAALNTVIGTLTATSDLPVTFSKQADPDNKFTVVGTELRLNAALDREAAATHSVTIRATSAEGTYDEIFTITVTNIVEAPVNTVAPAITGTTTVGSVLTASTGTWTSAAGALSYAYQWRRNGVDIGGATASTYTLVGADETTTITVRVTATNVDGSTAATSAGVGPITAGGSYEAEAVTYFDAMTVQPDSTRKGHINTLVAGLKTDGIWSKLSWLLLLASHDAQAARLNAVNPTKSVTATNSPTFTVDRGYTGDGTTAWLAFNELHTAAGHYTQNSACAFGYTNQQNGATGGEALMGAVSDNQMYLTNSGNGTNNVWRVNDTVNSVSDAPTSRLGWRAMNRSSSTDKRYYNGVTETVVSASSSGVPTTNAAGLRSTSNYNPDRVAVLGFGASLTPTEHANLRTRITTYLTAIGAN